MSRVWLIIVGVFLIIGLVLALLLVGRHKPTASTGTTKLEVWLPFDEVKAYQQLSTGFTQANPQVQLDFTYIQAQDAKDYEAKVVNAIANGQGPDIWLIRTDWLPKHVDKSVAAIPASAKTDPIAFVKSKLVPALVDENTYQGKLYGLPLMADSLAVIYNTSFYESVAQTLPSDQKAVLTNFVASWDDFLKQSAIVSQVKNGKISRSAVALGTAENTFAPTDVLTAFLNQAGAPILTDDQKTVQFNLAQFVGGQATYPAAAAVKFFTSFAKPSEPNYSWNATLGDPVDAFVQGKTGALIGYYSTLQDILAKQPKFTVKVSPLIQKDPNNRVDYGVSWTHIVNKNSSHPALAWSFLSYLTDPEVQATYVGLTNRLPSSSNNLPTLANEVSDSDLAASVFRAEFATIKPYSEPEWLTVSQVFQDLIKEVVNNNQAPQAAVDAAALRFKDFLPAPAAK